jgi:hypothetical protein
MAINVDIRLTGVRRLMRDLNSFDTKVAQEATTQALNRTINNMRKTAIEEAAKWMGIKKKLIEKRTAFNVQTKLGAIGIKGAKRNIRMEARGFALGRPFNLIRFGAVPAPGGVTANAWGTSKLYKGLGIARNPASFVFVVETRAKGKKRIRRGAYGPGLMQAMEVPRIAQAIETTGQVQFEKHFISAANFRLARNGWKRARVVT